MGEDAVGLVELPQPTQAVRGARPSAAFRRRHSRRRMRAGLVAWDAVMTVALVALSHELSAAFSGPSTQDLHGSLGALTALLAVVVSAGLAPYADYGASSATRLNPVSFVERMYAAGAAGSFDALGFHPYTNPQPPSLTHRASAWYQMERTSPSLRSLMIANGDGGKEIWATEFGFPTCTTSELCVSESVQAAYAREAAALWRSYPWAGVLLWYGLVDRSGDTFLNRYGLQRSDRSEKPAYAALRLAISG